MHLLVVPVGVVRVQDALSGGGGVTAPSSLAGVLLDEPGVYDIPEADYHRDPLRHLGGSASASTLRKMLPPSCPALARYAATHPEYKDAFDLGSVTHGLTLGRGCRIIEVPADSWQSGAAKGAREVARAQGAVALLSKDLAAARAMRDAVHADPVAHAVLTLPGAPERVLVWQEGDVWARAMLDRWPDPTPRHCDECGVEHTPGQCFGVPLIGDLKTTSKGLDDDSLRKTIYNYGYHQQADWYERGYRTVHGVPADFAFVFVTDTPPHLTRVVQLDDEFRRLGREANDRALALWAACQASGHWPGYGEDIALIGPPRWASYREDY